MEVNLMNKPFWKSMTFWGSVLLAVEAGLIVMGKNYPMIEPFLTTLGTFLTFFGFRRAIG